MWNYTLEGVGVFQQQQKKSLLFVYFEETVLKMIFHEIFGEMDIQKKIVKSLDNKYNIYSRT